MNFFDLRCPHCNAPLRSINGVDHYYCDHCQSEVLIDKIDENVLRARMANAEHEYRIFRLKYNSDEREREFQRREKARDNEYNRQMKPFRVLITIMIILGIIAGISFLVEENKYVRTPFSANYLEGHKYTEVRDTLKKAGFKNISCIKSSDSSGLFHNAEDVQKISIDGKTNFSSGKTFDKRVPVIIYYYSS